jgi:hypothetical protein
MKKLAICISGQYRSFDSCYKSIIETFIKSNPDIMVKIFICFSKEKDKHITIPNEIYNYCGKIKIEEDTKLPDISRQINYFKSANYNLNQELGAVSAYYQLLQMKESYSLMLEYEKEQNIIFDYVARVRPDISYESNFDWDFKNDSITILTGSDWNGYNDKFAIGTRKLMSKYMNRFDFWISERDENISTHNETNLKLWLDLNNINVTRSDIRYNYVRYNDVNVKKIEFIEITENKVIYKNVTNDDLDIVIKIFDRNDSLFGEIANYVFYSKKIKIPPHYNFFTVCDNKAEHKKMVSIEGKDLYLEHIMN